MTERIEGYDGYYEKIDGKWYFTQRLATRSLKYRGETLDLYTDGFVLTGVNHGR